MNWIGHIILLILGEIWSKASNLTSLLLIDVFAKAAQVNAEALNIKSYQPRQKHSWESVGAKCICIYLPQHLTCRSKKMLKFEDWITPIVDIFSNILAQILFQEISLPQFLIIPHNLCLHLTFLLTLLQVLRQIFA